MSFIWGKFTEENVQKVLAGALDAGETLKEFGIAHRPPRFFFLLAVLAELVPIFKPALLKMTRFFLVGVTNRRLVVLEVDRRECAPVQLKAFSLNQLPPFSYSKGFVNHRLTLNVPEGKDVLRFHRIGMKDNFRHAEAIEKALAPLQSRVAA